MLIFFCLDCNEDCKMWLLYTATFNINTESGRGLFKIMANTGEN